MVADDNRRPDCRNFIIYLPFVAGGSDPDDAEKNLVKAAVQTLKADFRLFGKEGTGSIPP